MRLGPFGLSVSLSGALAMLACRHAVRPTPPLGARDASNRHALGARDASNQHALGARDAGDSHAEVLTGEIATYKSGSLVGVEQYWDDGDRARSRVQLGPHRHEVELSRRRQAATCDGRTTRWDADTVALENGNWQAYVVAAERFSAAREPREVKVLLPCSGLRLDATISVEPEGDNRWVELRMGPLTSRVLVGPRGTVIRASVPAQQVTANQALVGVKHDVTPTPPGLSAKEISVISGEVRLSGTLWVPSGAPPKVPIALIVGGSGPTDRDGNNPLGVTSNAYRQLAAELAARGVATVRYDKRGVGSSGVNFDHTSTVLDDFTKDALAWVELIRHDTQFGKLTLIGHSEGGLVSILASQQQPCDALVLLATPGRPLDVLMREQLAQRMGPSLLGEYDRVVRALREHQSPDPIAEPLAPLFATVARAFFVSEIAVDPGEELKKAKAGQVTIVQGSTDLQVPVADAQTLAHARPDAKLHVLADVNHLLKHESARVSPQVSYTDPTRPLAPGVLDAIAAGIAR